MTSKLIDALLCIHSLKNIGTYKLSIIVGF